MRTTEILTAIRQHNELIDIFIYIIILSIVMVSVGVEFVWTRFVKNMCVMNLFDKRRAYDAFQNMIAPHSFGTRDSIFGRIKKSAVTHKAIHRWRAECIDIKAIRHAAIWLYLQYLPPQPFYIIDKQLLLAFGVALGAVQNYHVFLIAARLLDCIHRYGYIGICRILSVPVIHIQLQILIRVHIPVTVHIISLSSGYANGVIRRIQCGNNIGVICTLSCAG